MIKPNGTKIDEEKYFYDEEDGIYRCKGCACPLNEMRECDCEE
tara:strand:- start:112 stop:240 length:129 start_codon:yes stop_codon:yes gene_type:complete